MNPAESTAGPKDLLVRGKDLPWHPLGPGTWFKLLRASEETGVWTSLIKMEAGSRFAPHKHLGAAEFFVIRGEFDYRAGTAKAGDYGYEPLGAIHVDRANISIAAPVMIRELGWDEARFGVIFSAFLWGYTVIQLPGGYFADRFGGRLIPWLCLGWSAATFLTPFGATSFFLMMGLR